jgi:hypothetical protein
MFDEQKVWYWEQLVDFFSQVYSFTWGDGKTEFVYREQRTKRFGRKFYTTESVVITPEMPFSSAKTDKLIGMYPTISDLRDALEKVTKTKVSRKELGALKRVLEAEKLLERDDVPRDELVRFLGKDVPKNKEKSLGDLFCLAKQRGLIKSKYHSYTVEPFLYEDPTPPSVLNIFSPFELHQFASENDKWVRKSPQWKWLWVCWANEEEYKMKYLLDYFATKLQQPARKVCKFLTAFARLTGVGKTTVRPFTEAIYGKDKVMFCDEITDYLAHENSEQKGKLFIVIDDIESATKKQSLALKSKISSHTFKYKKLYQDRVTLPDYCDLIATSNSKTPKFVDSDNRRDELVVCNTSLQNNTPEMNKFWKHFYETLEDPTLMGHWFHFLAHRRITLDVRSQDCRFDLQTLQKHKLKSMSVVHRFIVKWPEDPEFLERCCPPRTPAADWFAKVRFMKVDGVPSLFVQKQRLFDYFQHWKKDTGVRLDCKMSTFYDGLAELSLTTTRKEVGLHRLTGVLFRAPMLRQSLKAFYNAVTDINLPWNWLRKEEYEAYEKGTFRFRNTPEKTGGWVD